MIVATAGSAMQKVWDDFAGDAVAYAPRLAGALVLLLIGWLVALGLKALALRLTAAAHRRLDRALPTSAAGAAPSEAPGRGLATMVFWTVLIFFSALALHVLAIDALSTVLGRLAIYLPNLLAGGVILFIAILMAGAASQLVRTALAETLGLERAVRFSRLIQFSVVAVAGIVAADQVGLEVSFLTTMLSVFAGAFLGAVALGIGLGSRDLFGNLLGAHGMRETYRPGQVVRVGEHSGRILELTATSLVLDTPEGRLSVPAKRFHELETLLVDEVER